MRKERGYEHVFENEGVESSCRIRVFKDGEKPVVIATQQHAPQGPVYSPILSAAEVFAADLITDGTLSTTRTMRFVKKLFRNEAQDLFS